MSKAKPALDLKSMYTIPSGRGLSDAEDRELRLGNLIATHRRPRTASRSMAEAGGSR